MQKQGGDNMYVIWVTEIEEWNMFVGVTTTKAKARKLIKKACRILKNKDITPDEFNENYFEIEKYRDGQVSDFINEYE
jgi:hypothetical protein